MMSERGMRRLISATAQLDGEEAGGRRRCAPAVAARVGKWGEERTSGRGGEEGVGKWINT